MSRSAIMAVAVAAVLASAVCGAAARGPAARVSTDRADVVLAREAGWERLSLPGHVSLSRPGEPELPSRIYRFVIPADQRVEDVVVTSLVEEALPGTHRVMPALAEAPIGERQQAPQPDATVYEGGGVYPRERVVYLGDGWLGGYRIASFAVHPVQYEPVTGRLVLAREVSFEVELGPGARRSRARHRMTERSSDLYRRLVRRLVDNPEEVSGAAGGSAEVVEVADGPGFAPRYTPSLNGSPVDYVIVTNELLAPYFQDLADWKTEKGIPAVVKTVSWIEANYPGGCDTAEKIRLFLQDAYSSWGTTYVLLGGDTPVVPARYVWSGYYGGWEISCDLYYSDLDGNWNWDNDSIFGEAYQTGIAPGDSVDLYPDVFVGRAPVTTIAETESFIDKTFTYETATDKGFIERNLFMAEILFPYDWMPGDPIGTDGAADIVEPTLPRVPAHIHDTKLYQYRAPFPGSYPLNKQSAIDSLNHGYNIVSHVGHGNKDILRVSAFNYITLSDADALANGYAKSGFVWLLDCTSTAIEYDCIAEHLMGCQTGGSTMLFGPTRYAFPMTTAAFYDSWFEWLYEKGATRAGVTCALAKADYADVSYLDNTNRWTQMSYVYLGDPELRIWTVIPKELEIAHDATVPLGDIDFTVTVTDPAPVDSALVCLVKDDEVYATGWTDPSGQVVLSLSPQTAGTVTVTASALDHTPEQSTFQITDTSVPHLTLDGLVIDDDAAGSSFGNDNGSPEAGELIEIEFSVRNGGLTGASLASAVLRCADPMISITDSTAAIGAVPPLGVTEVGAGFVVSIANDCPNEHDAPMTIVFSQSGYPSRSDDFLLRSNAPSPIQYANTYDDGPGGDGYPDLGETVTLSIELANDGNGRIAGISGRLRYPSSEITILDSMETWSDLDPNEHALGDGGFQFTVNSTPSEPLRLLIKNQHNIEWEHLFDLVPPVAPSGLDGRVKATTIFLSWNGLTEDDLWGYNVYRADEETGPYALVNDGVIEGVAYYEDDGLDENSLYYYHAAGVDSSGNEGPWSPRLAISTNPPSQAGGWPMAGTEAIYNTPLVADIDLDGDPEVIVGSGELYCWHHDAVEYHDGDGDPRTDGVYASQGTGGYRSSPAIGELDGDPYPEIVAAAWGNVGTEEDKEYQVFAWNAEDASVLTGWPVVTPKFCWGTPALADLDHDGLAEIILPCANRYLYCWKADGSELIDGDEDPLTVGIFADLRNSWNYGSPAVADIDGDHEYEIIQPGNKDSIFVFNADGSRVPGWPFNCHDAAEPSPAVGDVDQDGALEIVVASEIDSIWVLESDGSVADGWPRAAAVNGDFPPSPIVADLTGDGYLEIIHGDSDGTVRVWTHDGTPFAGWPQELGASCHSSPAVGDVDGDPAPEILIGCDSGDIFAFDIDGSVLAGWPIEVDAEIFSTPTLADLDLDGDVEVVLSSLDERVYVWDCDGAYDDGLGVEWPTFRFDVTRSGNYELVVPTSTPEGVPSPRAAVWLDQNVPNPFNPVTAISFGLFADVSVARLSIYNARGALVATLVDGPLPAGAHTVHWSGRDAVGAPAASGVYFARLTADGRSAARKIVLLK